MTRSIYALVSAICISSIMGCSTISKQEGALGGAAAGAGLGAIYGSLAGGINAGNGAAIGALAGGLAGALIGNEEGDLEYYEDRIAALTAERDDLQARLDNCEREKAALDASLEDEIVRPRATVYPMKSKTRKIAGFDNSDNSGGAPYGISAKWEAEDASSTAQSARTREIDLNAEELRLYVNASNAVVADGAGPFGIELEGAMQRSISWGFDNAFLNGDGAGKPKGVLNDLAERSDGSER